jgi:hypothetical protein
MSYQLNQSLSLYIPFIRDDVALETFQETFQRENIGKVSKVDFIIKPDSSLREAFVHFELFYNTKQAYDFQLTLESEQRIRIYYSESAFWSISKNFSKKASATIGRRKIRLCLTDDPVSPVTPVGEDEEHYLSDFDFEEEWKEEYNSVYGDEDYGDEDEQECDLSAFPEEKEFVQVHATPAEMSLVSSDYAAALEKQNEMLQGQLEFIAYDYADQNDQLLRQEKEIEHLYLLLAEKDALLEKKEQEKVEIVRYWQKTGLQIQDSVEERKDCLLEAITRNGYSEFKKINEFVQEREEKLVGILKDMKQEWSTKMGIFAEEFEKQMDHMKMMMTRHMDVWSSQEEEEEEEEEDEERDEEKANLPRYQGGVLAQRQVAADPRELRYLRQLDTFEGMARQYTYQYTIPTPKTYREFMRDEEFTIMGIIKSQAHQLAKTKVLSIIESGRVPDDFPINLLH